MTPSKSPWPSSPPKQEGLDRAVGALFSELCRRPGAHGRFLNTLSLLEHIGSRKILLSQGPRLREDVLRHLAEEARHAHFFRRAAERIAARPLDYQDGDLLAPAETRMYFGRLDAAVTRELGSERRLAYPYVTLAVELRAAWLYRLYEKALRAGGCALTLQSVLAEEDSHLQETMDSLRETDPLFEPRRTVFSRMEEPLFLGWLRAVRRAAVPASGQEELPL